MSPKARSMAYLREAGFCVTDVEKWGFVRMRLALLTSFVLTLEQSTRRMLASDTEV